MKFINNFRSCYALCNIPAIELTYGCGYGFNFRSIRNLVNIYGQKVKKDRRYAHDILIKKEETVFIPAFSLFQVVDVIDDICIIGILNEGIDDYKTHHIYNYAAIPIKLGNFVFIPELSKEHIKEIKLQIAKFPKKYIQIYDIYKHYSTDSWERWVYPLIAIFKCGQPEIIKTMSHGLIDMLQMFIACSYNTVGTYKTYEMKQELSWYIQKLYKTIDNMNGFYNYKEIPSVVEILDQQQRKREEEIRKQDEAYETQKRESNAKADMFLKNARNRRELLETFSRKDF